MHQLIDKKNRILLYLSLLILLSTLSNKSFNTIKKNLFLIDTIDVVGLSNINNSKITEKLDKLKLKNIFFVNKELINQILTKNNLVEDFQVQKTYPSKIYVKIKQTKFIAKIKGENEFLIGSNGKLISNENTNQKLPLLFGHFESKKFMKFKKVIDESKFKFQDLKSIFFHASKRWDIKTKNDILIQLPEKNLLKSLNVADKILKNDQFNKVKFIDLRISNQIIIK